MKTGKKLENNAKNLLLDKTCKNCRQCLPIVKHKYLQYYKDFEKVTGIKEKDILPHSIIDESIFVCSLTDKIIPKELTCNKWTGEKF